jgi:tRNA 2-selenouridine synthase
MQMRVLCGATGSAKTRVLHALEQSGAQVLDLEGYACHKGSLLGNLPGIEQPSQKRFETLIAERLESFDLSRPVYLEGESAKIGRLGVPLVLVEYMRKSPVIEVRATTAARLSYLLRDYAYLGDSPEALARKLSWLREMQGNETVDRWQAWAQARDLAPLFEELMLRHYDPHYERSQSNHFVQWTGREVLETDDLSDAGIALLAERCLALEKRS